MYSKYHCNAKLHNIGQDKIGQVYADLRQKSMVKKNLPLNFYIRLYILIGNKPKPDSCCSHFTKNGVTSMGKPTSSCVEYGRPYSPYLSP